MAYEPKAAEPSSPDSAKTDQSITSSGVLPTAIENALSKVPDKEARSTLSMAISRTSFGFGPDAETMKVMAETEVHEETCRLEAFKSSLANRDKQAERDHEFRKKKLNHQSLLTASVALVTIGGIGSGLMLSMNGNSTLGNPVLIASFTVLTTLAGKLLSSRDKD
jgi:hypothetical protein